MAQDRKTSVGRRDFLRALGAGAGVAVTAAGPLATAAHADGESNEEKRKARYQPNAPEVQTYYRVNRYPATK
ncbi:MAG: twin-arginine translocation signal domain-containing protein [Pseudorhodoplanes sp.]|nr:twin-arginine translocation signal domain-containing protein [Pseudorhodoplanes sp.]